MTTFVNLRAAVSRDLADPSGLTFDVNAVTDFISQGLAALSRIAPDQYQEDLDVQANVFSYQLRSALYTVGLSPREIRLHRVEYWAGTPSRFGWKVRSKAGQPSQDSLSGWAVFAGNLEVPQHEVDAMVAYDPNGLLRVWGYAPYIMPVNDNDIVPVGAELENALRTFCKVEGLKRLTSSRVLFKQWQARSNNTDVTLGSLNSDLQVAQDEWRRLARELKVLTPAEE